MTAIVSFFLRRRCLGWGGLKTRQQKSTGNRNGHVDTPLVAARLNNNKCLVIELFFGGEVCQ